MIGLRAVRWLVAAASIVASVAHATVLWRIDASAPTRIDADTASSQSVEGIGRPDVLVPLADGGAWLRRGDELARVGPDLVVAARATVPAAAALHWDDRGGRLWVAARDELLRYDADLRLTGLWRFDAPIVDVAGFGPEAIWIATGSRLLRIGSDGGVRDDFTLDATGSAVPATGLLADHARALVWVVHGDAEAVAIDASASLRVAGRVTLPRDTRAVALDSRSGQLLVERAKGWALAMQPDSRFNASAAGISPGGVGVLRLSAGAAPSIVLAGPLVETKAQRVAGIYAAAREPVRFAFDDLNVDVSSNRLRVALAPEARCGPVACERADGLLRTMRADIVVDGHLLQGSAELRDGRWSVAVDGPPLPGPGVYSLSIALADGFGNRGAGHEFDIDVDANGSAKLREVTPKATPVVAITAPLNNASFVAPASITITANASVTGATLTKVEFYRNGTLLATDTAAPFTYAWTNVAVGTYALTARAYDNTGGMTTSATVNVTVRANVAPTVTLTAPANNAVFTAPATINLAATATDSDGTVAKVDFYRGTTLIGTDTSAPFQFSWTNVAGASYALTAKATDDKGAVTTSATVNVVVNRPPVTSITAPANNAVLIAPVNVTVNASASDPDGSIAKVEFYRGSTLVATDTATPFSYVWNNAALGTHTFTSRAFDNRGATTTSTPVTVTVKANVGPSVAITSPAPGAQFVYPASIPITATASDSDGTIARVEFHYDYGALGSDSSSPYSMTWNSNTTGNYTLTAKAVDNKGAVTTSAPVPITINHNQAPIVTVTGVPPVGELVLSEPPTFQLTANVSDADGSVTSVAFYSVDISDNPEGDLTLLGTVTQPPYVWTHAAPTIEWLYIFRAVATDNGGATGFGEAWYSVTPNSAPVVGIAEPGGPVSPQVFVSPATVVLVADAKDYTPGDAVVRVEFIADGAVIGTATTATGSPSEFIHVWRNVPVGDHRIQVRAYDTSGTMSEGYPLDVRVIAAGTPPTVALAQPATGQVYGGSVPLQVNITGGSAAIAQVDYVNAIGHTVAQVTTPPYAGTWTAATPGRHAITAVVVDVDGRATSSPTVFFDVAEPNIKPRPIVVLTAPTALSSISADAPIVVAAEALSPGFPITKVEFHNGSTLIGTATSAPYQISWANPAPLGKATLTATATDSTSPAQFSVGTSSPITVTLTSTNPRPIVTLTAPLTGASYPAPATINLAANASDPGGSVVKVEFFAGSTLIGSDTSSPYTATWSNVAAGTYAVTAKATDNLGASTVSSVANVTIVTNAAPVVAITAPTAAQSFAFGAPITLSATASDADGTLPVVRFYDGATLLATTYSPSYSFVWSTGAVGNHTLTATASDSFNAVTTSTPVAISITANALPVVTLALPRNGQRFVTGQSIDLVVTASDSDGSIARVEFLAGTQVLATTTAAPYGFRWTNVPTGSHAVTARVTDNRGAIRTSAVATVQVAPLALTVTTPAEGASIASDFVFVRGTFTGPANAGVMVNGVRAQTYGNQFFANDVPLQPGSNAVRVVTVTPDGQSMALTRNVTSTAIAPFRVQLEPDNGYAPVTSTIRVQSRSGLAITGVGFENLGTAVLNVAGANQETLGTLTAASLGIVAPTIVITDSTGAIHRQTVGLLANYRVAVDAMLKEVWNTYTATLAAGRVDLALASLSPVTADRYRPILEPLAPHFAQIVPTWSAPNSGLLEDDIGEYTIARTIDGQKRLFFVYFVKDAFGIWRLDAM